MWKTLLVPHDFSSCADAALAVAEGLARAHGASLVVLHVSDLDPNVPADARIAPPGEGAAMQLDEYVRHGASVRLEAVAAPIRARGIELATRACVGDVTSEILAAAIDSGASAIVMGTHGREGLAHLLLGSVAEKIVRRAAVPVVTVRTPERGKPSTTEERFAEDELAG